MLIKNYGKNFDYNTKLHAFNKKLPSFKREKEIVYLKAYSSVIICKSDIKRNPFLSQIKIGDTNDIAYQKNK